MAIMDPALLPADRNHLVPEDRAQLLQLENLCAQGRYDLARDVVEDLWIEAIDAHKDLYKGLVNALTAVCAYEAGKPRGAREIASQSRVILAPFPRTVLEIDLEAFLDSVNDYLRQGEGPVLLRYRE